MRTGVRLAVDVGSVRIGLAVSDPAGSLAIPVRAVPHDAAAISALLTEAAQRDALEFVVGLPVGLSGAEGAAATAARSFALELATASTIPVRLVDERLSTVTAHGRLQDAGVRGTAGRNRTRDVIDAAAAAVILESALDTERSTGSAPGELVES